MDDDITRPIRSELYGVTVDGQEVRRFILRNGPLELSVIEYGAIVEGLVLLSNEQTFPLCQRLSTLQAYEADTSCTGAIVGPFMDYRVALGLTSEEQRSGSTESLHDLAGGVEGLHCMVWEGREAVDNRGPSVELELVHPDGMNGYSGNLYVRVRFVLGDSGVCFMEYEALCDDERPINFAHHCYLGIPSPSHTPNSKPILVLNRPSDSSTGPALDVSGSKKEQRESRGDERSELSLEVRDTSSLHSFVQGDEALVALASLEHAEVRISLHSDQRALYLRTASTQDKETSFVCFAPHAKPVESNGDIDVPFVLEPGQLYRQQCEIRVVTI